MDSSDPPAITSEIHAAFLLRVTWDALADGYRIQLRPAGGGEERIFSDLESLFAHLEALLSARSPSGERGTT